MSVLVKGMKMPKYCRVCPFSIPLPIQLVHDGLSSECVADSKRMKVCTDHYKRPKGCPLVEVAE